MLLSLVVSLGIDVVLGWAIVIWVVRRSVPGARAEFAFRPMTLLIVIGAVVFTRLTGFEPGIVFGLVAGVAFAVLADRVRAEAKVVLIGLACAFGFAVVAWALYGLFGGPASGESFWGTLLQETLASTAIAGMAALPIALVPLRGLAGHAVWAWNRWVWVACYAIALVAFFIVLMPMPFSWQGVHLDLLSWVVLYLAYAAAAVIAWLVLARPWRKEADAEAVGPDPVAAGVGAGSGEVPAGRLEE